MRNQLCGTWVILWLLTISVSAQEPIRTWRDASGVFAVEAQLVELRSDIVKLRLPNGETVEVGRDRLCQSDIQFLADFEKTNNPFLPTRADNKNTSSLSSKAERKPFPSRDLPEILPTLKRVKVFTQAKPLGSIETSIVPLTRVPPGEAFVDSIESGSRVSRLLVVDREKLKVAVSVSPSIYSSRSRQRSRIYIGTLPSGPFEMILDMADSLSLLDYNAETDQALAVGAYLGDKGDRELLLLHGLSSGELIELARFRLPADTENMRVDKALLTGKNRAVVVIAGVAYGWDLDTGDQLFQTDPHNRAVGKIEFRHDGKLMAFTVREGIHFVNTENGENLGFLPLSKTYASHLAFDPRSSQLAYCEVDRLGLYNYSTTEKLFAQTTTWALASRVMGWIAPNLILAGDGIVIDTEKGLPVWRYQAKWENLTIWEDSITLVDTSSGFRLQTLEIPDQGLRTALNSAPPMEQLLLTDVGSKVKLQLSLLEILPDNVNEAELQKKLKSLAETAGWVPDDTSQLILAMSILPGEPITDLYQPHIHGQPNSERSEVKITPMISRIELRDGEQVIWGLQSRNDQPHRYGNSPFNKEEYVRRREQAMPEFFNSIVLPVRIARPPFTYGMGTSYANRAIWRVQTDRNLP